jgi:hypothetical protein
VASRSINGRLEKRDVFESFFAGKPAEVLGLEDFQAGPGLKTRQNVKLGAILCKRFPKSKVITKRSFRDVANGLFRRLGSRGLGRTGLKAGFFGDLGRKSPIQGGCGRPKAKQRGFPLAVVVGHLENTRYGSMEIGDRLNVTI